MIGRWFLLVWLLAGAAHAAPSLVPVQFASDTAARTAWVAKEGASPVRAERDGVRFFCPFQRGADRFYWDCPVTLNLRDTSSLTLEVTATDAESARAVSIYFKSGPGWYHWSRPIRGTGRQKITIVKSDCSEEDAPTGWHRIEAIRFAPWRATDRAAAFVVHGLSTRRDDILLVEGTSSLPNQSERNFSHRTAQRIGQWLDDVNIAYGVIDDDGVIAGGLAQARLAILCYNSTPNAAELKALQKFIDRGGKLIVFYSASEQLARKMGVRLGTFEISDDPGRWQAMRFNSPNIPQRVYDTAWNRIPASPANANTRIIAAWEDAAGRSSSDVACLAGPAGYWFTHVPRSEDASGKRRMMLALIGSLVPDAWREAARFELASCGKVADYPDLPAALKGLQQTRNATVEKTLDPIPALHRQAAALFAQGSYAQSFEVAASVRQRLLHAYGLAQSPKRGELRGVWDHDGVGWVPGNWRLTCRELAGAGINAIFPNLSWPGKAHYPSRVVPQSKSLKRYGDQARQCIDAARASNMQVHLWKICWNLENAPADMIGRMRSAGRLQQDAAGLTKNWLCPSHPKNVAYELSAIRELATTYDFDGLHLDYIRYPGATHCYCATSRKAFEKSLGYGISSWPQGVQKGGALEDAFNRFRANEITSFVRQVRAELNAARPGTQLSAAVFRQYPSCRDSIGQDWGRWLKEGLVDFVVPMTYTPDLSNFQSETRTHLSLPGARGKVLPGIGVTASESRLSADQVIAQIRAAREEGTPGFVLFDLSTTLRKDILPILKLGIIAQ